MAMSYIKDKSIFSPNAKVAPRWADVENWTIFTIDRERGVTGSMRKTTLNRIHWYMELISMKREFLGLDGTVFYDDVLNDLLDLADVFRDMIGRGESMSDIARKLERVKGEIRKLLDRGGVPQQVPKVSQTPREKAEMPVSAEDIPF